MSDPTMQGRSKNGTRWRRMHCSTSGGAPAGSPEGSPAGSFSGGAFDTVYSMSANTGQLYVRLRTRASYGCIGCVCPSASCIVGRFIETPMNRISCFWLFTNTRIGGCDVTMCGRISWQNLLKPSSWWRLCPFAQKKERTTVQSV